MLFKTPWLQSASELYRPSDSRFSANLIPTFVDRECLIVNAKDPHGRIAGFSMPEPLLFLPSSFSLYSRG
jgi:hypothetical protein